MILTVIITLFLTFCSSSEEKKTNVVDSFIVGTWKAKEKVHVKITELGIDKWYTVGFKVKFGSDASFSISANNSLYNLALKDYKKKNKLDYDKYELINGQQVNNYKLKLYKKLGGSTAYHKLRKISSKKVILQITLDNDKNKNITLKK